MRNPLFLLGLSMVVVLALTMVSAQSMDRQDFLTQYSENPGEAIQGDPAQSFAEYPGETWDHLRDNPELLRDPEVFKQMVQNSGQGDSELWFSMKSKPFGPDASEGGTTFSEEFEAAVAGNQGNVNALNENPAALEQYLGQRGLGMEEGAQLKTVTADGRIFTRGTNPTDFNPDDFPESEILADGSLRIKESVFTKAEVQGGTVTLEDDVIDVRGGRIEISSSTERTVRTDGSLVINGREIRPLGEGGLTAYHHGESLDKKLRVSGDSFQIVDTRGQSLTMTGRGDVGFDTFDFEDVELYPSEQGSAVALWDGNNELVYEMDCISTCVERGNALLLPVDTRISHPPSDTQIQVAMEMTSADYSQSPVVRGSVNGEERLASLDPNFGTDVQTGSGPGPLEVADDIIQGTADGVVGVFGLPQKLLDCVIGGECPDVQPSTQSSSVRESGR